MDWNEATDLNIKTLRRIVTLLLALASLAERASGRSHAVRWSVLWLLRPGETIARDYVAALTGDTSLASTSIAVPGESAADATRLAACFRALAAALVAFAEQILTVLLANPGHPRCTRPTQCAALASLFDRLSPVARRDSS
jgi:hypothetical protein